uniref:Transcription factor 19 (SC1), like n=1 Tax=Labrus bergylta TaxID=56723 RepID=A0A3Q3FGM8_9LABR
MLSGVQPCFQLLRIGSSAGDSARDLYTFRPALNLSVFRLGRAAELCDVTLDSSSVSRIHAELQAEREASEVAATSHEEGWTVHIKDRSSHGTWVNEVRLQPGIQWELSDNDTLTFGGQSTSGSPEFYFLFQKVKVRPLDFDAITIPKAGTFSSDLQNRIRTSLDRKVDANLDMSKLSINRATVILNSIGSLSKMKGSAWTFKRSLSHDDGAASDPGSSSPPLAVGISSLLPPSTSRRKSAHTVLLEDDSSDEPRTVVEDGQRARAKKRRRLYKSESESFSSPPPLQPKSHNDVRRPLEEVQTVHRVQTVMHGNIAAFRQQKPAHCSSTAQRGRRRAHSSPVFSPLVVGGENYSLASPSVRIRTEDRVFVCLSLQQATRTSQETPPPSPALPALSILLIFVLHLICLLLLRLLLSSSSSDEDEEEDEEGVTGGAVEPCAAPRCRLPQQDTVQWIQCDVCDAWYHIDCLHVDRKKLLKDPNADFHCGCR